MPRAPNDRPSRRLDAFLTVLRKHRVYDFEAADLDGIGKGLKWRMKPEPPVMPAPPPAKVQQPTPAGDPDLALTPRGEPIDELALVAACLDGPVPEDRAS